MSEKNIQKVLDIEKQADELYNKAVHDAQQLPVLAEQEAQAIVEKALSEAREQARQLVSKAQAEGEVSQILSQAEEKNHQIESSAMSNFDRAVAYILDRVAGKE
jgi:vacuolar-type H+-ATPase subunit H